VFPHLTSIPLSIYSVFIHLLFPIYLLFIYLFSYVYLLYTFLHVLLIYIPPCQPFSRLPLVSITISHYPFVIHYPLALGGSPSISIAYIIHLLFIYCFLYYLFIHLLVSGIYYLFMYYSYIHSHCPYSISI
jgi:hypothetical protein